MFDHERKTEIKRIPQQQRSQDRFELVLETAMRLIAARGYESVSMREIAREAGMPIATVYQYFPTKLAIVREMWSRYTGSISEALAAGLPECGRGGEEALDRLIGGIIDRMSALQNSNPAFVEIWSSVGASMELRALNVEDTLHNARLVAEELRRKAPHADPTEVLDRALVTIEAASAVTRVALSLPEPHRARLLYSLKRTIPLLIAPESFRPAAQIVSGKTAGSKKRKPSGPAARRQGKSPRS
jgi:AcrR family transcriptional regulator